MGFLAGRGTAKTMPGLEDVGPRFDPEENPTSPLHRHGVGLILSWSMAS